MRGSRHVLHRRRLGHRHALQRIEKLDRHLKFLMKELAHVRHSSTAATQENASGAISLLLGAVVRDGTHQFCMEPGHGTAGDFRNPRNAIKRMFVVRAPMSSSNEQSPLSA